MQPMPLTINLLGRPHLDAAGDSAYRFRSQKSWALLAYLLLSDQPTSRAQLANLLFDEAEDPLGALRWSLAELRRGLGEGASVEGDPVRLTLPVGAVVDADVVMRGSWRQALDLPGVAAELLAGQGIRGSHAFDVWLTAERRRLAAASEAILHEAALGLMASGDVAAAVDAAVRAVALNPLDESSQALLIRLYRQAGDVAAARSAYDAARRVLLAELGVEPGADIEAAWHGQAGESGAAPGRASVEALIEAGAAALDAGAADSGLVSLRTAVALADESSAIDLQVTSRVVLAEALIHSVRGRDEEGLAALHAADRMASGSGDDGAVARIRTELGYVDFLRARYDRAVHWLSDALTRAGSDDQIVGAARAYLGSVESDRADYPSAAAHLEEAVACARRAGQTRREAYAASMVGRMHLLQGEPALAIARLQDATRLCEQGRWLSLLPWPQALLGEALLAGGDVDAAAEVLEQAFARACHLADPCWEGTAARGLALVSEARGEVEGAFDRLEDARVRSRRAGDPYVWLDAYILDAMATIGIRHRHPRTAEWVSQLQSLAERTDMRELTVRALVHAARLGSPQAADGARLLVTGIDNPALTTVVEALGGVN